MRLTKGMKEWKKRQPRGAIMKPSTFKRIARKADGAKGERIAGKAYQRTLQAKYRRGMK